MEHFLAIGDLHISEKTLGAAGNAMTGILNLLRKRKDEDRTLPKFAVIMGDIMDKKKYDGREERVMAEKFIKRLSDLCLTFVLIGNHDRTHDRHYDPQIHPFTSIENVNGKLYIINEPRSVSINKKIYLFMPYVPPGRFRKHIEEHIEGRKEKRKNGQKGLPEKFDITDYHCIFAHQEFYGVQLGPIKSTNGDVWDENEPMVISGHIHHLHKLQPNILYVGSCIQVTYSESVDKGPVEIWYDSNTKELQYTHHVLNNNIKKTKEVDLSNPIARSDMSYFDEDIDTKYILKGTEEQIKEIEESIKDKGLQLVYNVVHNDDGDINGSFNDIVGRKLDEELHDVYQEVINFSEN